MINHKNLCSSLAKKGGTITLSLNDQHSIGVFSVGKEGSTLGASFGSMSEGMGRAPTQHRVSLWTL